MSEHLRAAGKRTGVVAATHLVIAVPLFAAVLMVLEAAMGPALVYGGSVCAGAGSVAGRCPVPPVGLVIALAVAVFGSGIVIQGTNRLLQRAVDK